MFQPLSGLVFRGLGLTLNPNLQLTPGHAARHEKSRRVC